MFSNLENHRIPWICLNISQKTDQIKFENTPLKNTLSENHSSSFPKVEQIAYYETPTITRSLKSQSGIGCHRTSLSSGQARDNYSLQESATSKLNP